MLSAARSTQTIAVLVAGALLALASCRSEADGAAHTGEAPAATATTGETGATTSVAATEVPASPTPASTETPPSDTAAPPSTPATTTSVGIATSMPETTTSVGIAPPAEPMGMVTSETISVGGVDRTFRLYVPSELAAGPVPLFVALHGGMGWGAQFAQTDHIESLAESNGFVVVHPDGVQVQGGPGGAWNGGACCGAPARDGVDDVAFIASVIDAVEARLPIDPARVFAIGHSNGAIMSFRLACELSDRIVGIGIWAGALEIDGCAPSTPVSIIQGHGDADLNIPIGGGDGSQGPTAVDFAPPHDGFVTLADADGCGPGGSTTNGDLTVETRDRCPSGVAAEFVTIHTATHSWPGGTPQRVPASGPGYAGWDATAEIVGFLLGHPRAT